jgi:hypothetical protein
MDELDAFPHRVFYVHVEVKSSVQYIGQVFCCILLSQLFVVKVYFVVPLDLRSPPSYYCQIGLLFVEIHFVVSGPCCDFLRLNIDVIFDPYLGLSFGEY